VVTVAPAAYPDVFKSFPFERGSMDAEVIRTRVGSVQRRSFDAGIAADQRLQDRFLFEFYCAETVLTDNTGVFEWLDVCETVRAAEGGYTFVELGAGYARWAVIAYFLATRFRHLPTRLICVEPEPTHYEWVLQNLRDNGIRPGDHDVREGAVSARDGYVLLDMGGGEPSACYGQSVVGRLEPGLWDRLRLKLGPRRRIGSRGNGSEAGKACVKAYSLETLLRRVSRVDLIHMDIQGSELDVLSAAAAVIDAKVKRLHVGTHGVAIEAGLRDLLGRHGWTCLHDLPGQGRRATEFGEMDFDDGIQTWVNPRLG
jgi:FkbM family methyltransferase